MFWGQIFEMEILMDIHVLRSPDSGNNIFSGWSDCLRVFVRVFAIVCVCACY